MLTEQDLDALISTVRQLAKQFPDAIYSEGKCLYTSGRAGNGQGCVLGQAAKICNPSLYKSMAISDKSCGQYGTAIYEIPSVKNAKIDAERQYHPHILNKINWLVEVQSLQDDETPWGECIKLADRQTDE